MSEIAFSFQNVTKVYCNNVDLARKYAFIESFKALFPLRKKQKSKNLKLRKGEKFKLKDFDLEVQKGQTVVIYGPQGAGKSTIANLLMGIHLPSAGKIKRNGSIASIHAKPIAATALLTLERFIKTQLALLGVPSSRIHEKRKQIIKGLNLHEHRFRKLRNVPAAWLRKTAIFTTLLTEADIYVFDDTYASVVQFSQYVDDILNSPATTIICTTVPEPLPAKVDRLICLEEGKITYDGPFRKMEAPTGESQPLQDLNSNDRSVVTDTDIEEADIDEW